MEKEKHLLRAKFMQRAVSQENKTHCSSNPPDLSSSPDPAGWLNLFRQHFHQQLNRPQIAYYASEGVLLDSCALPPPFSSLMCTNIREGGRECMLCLWQQRAACVFEESSSLLSGLNKTRTGQWQSTDCVTRGMAHLSALYTKLKYREQTGDINLCMQSGPVSKFVMVWFLRNRLESILGSISFHGVKQNKTGLISFSPLSTFGFKYYVHTVLSPIR